MKVVDAGRMAEIDRRTQADFGVPSALLMEDAGVRLFRVLAREAWGGRPPALPVRVLAGKGNNGGDALVMARQLWLEGFRGVSVLVAAGGPAPGTPPAVQLQACRRLGVEVADLATEPAALERALAGPCWLLDGLFGTGLKGALKPPLSALVERVNALVAAAGGAAPATGAAAAARGGVRVIAIDVPSGLGDGFREGDPCLRAELTLTVGLPKRCLYLPKARRLCGSIRVVPGIFPPQLVEDPAIPGEMLLGEPRGGLPDTRWGAGLTTGAGFTGAGAAGGAGAADGAAPGAAAPPPWLPPDLPPDTHKGRRGHLAVFAGSPGTTGAAWLCAHAAARSRAGLVTLYADREAWAGLAPGFRSVMIRPWDPASPPPALDLGRHSALLVGPGWGTGPERAAWLEALLQRGLPGVLDADGLTLLAGLLRPADGGHGERLPPRALGGRWVLTPHPGEFARLAGLPVGQVLDDPLPPLQALCADLQAVVVLKGHVTWVAEPGGRWWILDGMNPALGTGGSGDVLAGIIGGFLAGGLEPARAAALGVLTHSRAAAAAWRKRGWFLAEDLPPFVSACLRR